MSNGSEVMPMRLDARPPSALLLRMMPVILGVLTAVGPVSTDIYLPAFPALEHSFGTAAGSAQITLAVWFIGLACGQITQGPFSDRFGRRLPLLLGGVLYTLASIGCAVAHDLWSFTACRFIAALGASAAMVVPAATVRDVSEGADAARKMSTLVLIMGVVPILAPAIGGVVLGFASWRVIFWAAAVYGVVCLALVWRVLPETLPRERRSALPPVALLARYLHIARDAQFSTNAVIGGFSTFVCFAYLGGAPGLFIRELHFTPTQFGVLFGLNAVAMIGASQINGLLVRRVGVSRLLHVAVAAALAASLLLVVASLARRAHPTAAMFVAPVMLCLAPLGLIGPNATVGALARHAQHAGSAAALLGTLQYMLGAASGFIIGLLPGGTPLSMAGLMAAGALGMVIADRVRLRDERRHGAPAMDLSSAAMAMH